MTVTSVKEISPGRSSDNTSTRGSTETRHVRVFRVITDNPLDADLDIIWATGIPQVGEAHPDDGIAFVRNQNATQDGRSKLFWTVRITYSTAFPVNENPLDDPPTISWSTQTYQRPLIRDRSTGILVTNAAGDVFDPPFMLDDSRMSASVRANLSEVPVALLSFRDAVNSTAFVIDGVSVAVGYAKISTISVGEEQSRNTVGYRVFAYSMQIKDSDEVVGWQPVIPNLGFYFKSDIEAIEGQRIRFTDASGSELTVPQMLTLSGDFVDDGSGNQSTDPSDATYITFTGYASLDFNSLPGVGV